MSARLWLAGLALGLAACASEEPNLELALNWKPEPEFGGIFEAERSGAFARRGLDFARTGGPGAPVVQMVTARQVPFGIASADEVVLARAQGSDVVAIFATYQTAPVGLMTHAARGVETLAALFAAGGTLAVEPGMPYVKWLERRYGFKSLEVVPYSYSIGPFLEDPALTQQVFVTSEPIAARRAGAKPRVFLVADSGYDPYTAVVITHGQLLRDEPHTVEALVAALREGWRAYLDDPEPANAVMSPLNPEMDDEAFRLAAEAQVKLIETQDAPLGSMRAERWTKLGEQLQQLGLLETPEPAGQYFVNPGNG